MSILKKNECLKELIIYPSSIKSYAILLPIYPASFITKIFFIELFIDIPISITNV